MKHLMYMTLLSTLMGLPVIVLAQAEKPAVAKVEAPAADKSGKRSASRAHVDARECLKLSTNMEIHKCAEKYR